MRGTAASAVALAIGLASGGCGGGGGRGEGDDEGAGVDADRTADAGDGDPSAMLFDEGVIRDYQLDVAPADWAWLNQHALEETYVDATLRLEGETAAATVRFKGAIGSLALCFDAEGNRTCDKLSMKVSFNEVDPEGRFHGVKKLNFHSMESDPTKMHDAIGYRLFRDAGVPAPRTAYVRLTVNGELQGLFVLVEQIDGRFTRLRFPDGGEGNLYKEVWPIHASEQPYLDALETNQDEAPSADRMVRFAAALTAGGDAGFVEVVEAWTDVDLLVQYMAVGRLIDSWDDIIGWYCPPEGGGDCFNHNYYWYESSTADRVWLIPWDLDHSLEEPSPIRTYFSMPDWDDTAAHCDPRPIFFDWNGLAPACDPFVRGMVLGLWDRYAAASQALLDGDFAVAAMNARIDELAGLITNAVAEDPNGPPHSTWMTSVATLRSTIVAKRDHVAAKL